MSTDSHMEMQSILNSTTFNLYWDQLAQGSAMLVIEMFFYGFYLNLFLVAIYTLFHHKTAGKRVLLTFTWVMAILDTTQMVLRLVTNFMEAHLFLRVVQHDIDSDAASKFASSVTGALNSLNLAQNGIFSFNNFVTDSLFLYRCYMIWGSQWKVIMFPGLLVLSTFVAGCVSITSPNDQTLEKTPYIMAAITNFILLFLTAGRIWWIRRNARHIGTTALKDRYSKVIAMIVESGAMYCVFAILLVVTYPLGFSNEVLQAIGTHLVVSKALSSIQTCDNVSYP
ncbi:hypothetical protein MVEN_01816500 [Mycena venus]|uniref:Uncharacterized protein n=1 Tax=Mycena venus TaxID=2733690 RepID=A0A8H6XKF6_9AGAR|nr:hypothetical protein MVEN_01816500 [Mycena venus]